MALYPSSSVSGWLNIEPVVANELCTQCGVCLAACPCDNIRITRDAHFRYLPRVSDEEPCRARCKSLCVDVCAGVHEDPALWQVSPYSLETYGDFCTGDVLETWVGYSADEAIRQRGTSGGIVTGLLVYLLESGSIDGALVVGANRTDPLQHDIVIARSRQEIEDAWGSKYYPMPVGARLADMRPGEERYAVVLLGCHTRSLRLLEQRNPLLRSSILLRIGLICGYCAGFKAIQDQALEWGITDLAENRRIDFREGKWPGYVRIQTPRVDRRTLIYNFLSRIPFTTNYRCTICSDLMNETADISVGDAWLREITARKDEGWSVVAVRTAVAREVIRTARESGALCLEPANTEILVRSQEKPMRYKKHALRWRLQFARHIMGRRLPEMRVSRYPDGFRINLWNKLGNVLFMLTMWTFAPRDRLRRAMFRRLPRRWIHWYVRSMFLMIAHEGESSFLRKWFVDRDPMLNCDA